jgi:4-hydroxy-3-methylbut-2-enyl diphosphate reductase
MAGLSSTASILKGPSERIARIRTMSAFEYHRKGFGTRRQIHSVVEEDYRSRLVDVARERDHRIEVDGLAILLAKEFGFCYGVDRAVDYAYETRARFPDRRLFLSGQIIHNPRVNSRLQEMGVEILRGEGLERFGPVESGDVVLIPAFGCTKSEFDHLEEREVVLVDTTCGSVLVVWKNVERYAKNGFTALVHGKVRHEETRATCSRALMHPEGRYVVVLDLEETRFLCRAIEGEIDGDAFLERMGHAVSPGFEPARHLGRIGCANQTTMLSSESLEVAGLVRDALARRYGEGEIEDRFIAFDTICSATQDRQDAVRGLLDAGPDLMIVIGGYNSSNTGHLAEIAEAADCATFHVDRAECLVSADEIRHRPVGADEEVVTRDWLGSGPTVVGVTAGASTPNIEVGGVLERLLRFRGVDPAEVAPKPPEEA